ncbi:MAG: DNA repair protein RadA, partial [Giesbergeria sp.]|nr:DNA repair protein RadA [Giesbergeria sp.]
MSKDKTLYVCSDCGAASAKWLGKCPQCNAWNTLVESVAQDAGGASKHRYGTAQFTGLAMAQEVTPLSAIEATDIARTPSGIDELDRVLGGGIVEGSVVLIGGDPGI